MKKLPKKLSDRLLLALHDMKLCFDLNTTLKNLEWLNGEPEDLKEAISRSYTEMEEILDETRR